MGNRLSKIVTKTGDDGSSSLDGKVRLPKNHPNFEFVGELDELGCYLGLTKLYTHQINHKQLKLIAIVINSLSAIQQDLFNIGGSVVFQKILFTQQRIDELEKEISDFIAILPASKEFIIAEGCIAGHYLNVSRAISRRVERTWWRLPIANEQNYKIIGKYLNRLSDWLFTAMRIVNFSENNNEVLWNNPTKRLKRKINV